MKRIPRSGIIVLLALMLMAMGGGVIYADSPGVRTYEVRS